MEDLPIQPRYVMTRASLLSTMILIDEFLLWKKERGWQHACFSYRGLRNYLFYKSKKNLEWHTVERAVRELASSGILKRTRKPGVFCVSHYFNMILWEIRALWRRRGIRRDEER